MILIDKNNVAHFADALGIDESKAWGKDWLCSVFNTDNAQLVDLPAPKHFMGGRFTLVDGELVPDAGWSEEIAKLDSDERRAAEKAEREKRVAAIKVTTKAGHTFDGDEVSQGRMARAIIALNAAGANSVTWVLADNSVIEATPLELAEALALAGAAQAAIWVIE